MQAALKCKEAVHAQAKVVNEKRKLEDYISKKAKCVSFQIAQLCRP